MGNRLQKQNLFKIEVPIKKIAYSNDLLGLTIQQAEIFLEENCVYFDINHTEYALLNIKVLEPHMIYSSDHLIGQVQVQIENDVIVRVLG